MAMHRLLNLRLLLPLAVMALVVVGIACGSAEEPTATSAPAPAATEAPAPAATEAPAPAATTAPAPSGQQATSAPAPTAVPDATIRPTNTPAPTATQVVARPTPTPAGGPQYGGIVNMSAYADSRDWDPKGSSSLSSIQAVSQLYNQIVQYDTVDTSLIVCDLCESWESTNGGQTITFKIRDDVQWLDGEQLDGDDVHNSMLRYGDLDSKMGRSGLWRQYTLEASNGGVNLIDNNTVEFNLKFASGAFIKFLAVDYVKVLPKHILDQGVDLNLAESVIEHRSGSGPFVLDEYQRGSFYKVSKNPNYFKDGKPYFDGIDHTIIVDPSVLIAQLKGGQIDMSNGGFTNMTPTQVFELERDTDGQYRGVAVQPTADWGLMLNVKKEPFNDARVRQAIALAIDYQQWNDLVFDNTSGVGCPLMGLAHSFEECETWPGLRPKDTPEGEADLAMAKQLMVDAGYADGFETRMDVRQVGTYPEQCSVVKDQLENALNIVVTDFQTYPSAAGYDLFATSRPADQGGRLGTGLPGRGPSGAGRGRHHGRRVPEGRHPQLHRLGERLGQPEVRGTEGGAGSREAPGDQQGTGSLPVHPGRQPLDHPRLGRAAVGHRRADQELPRSANRADALQARRHLAGALGAHIYRGTGLQPVPRS